MKILVVCTLFPPDAKGGAELCAYNAAVWLRSEGFEVGVLTTARSPEEKVSGSVVDGFRTWKICSPRLYQMHDADKQSGWKKTVWHLQDHLDPRNGRAIGAVLKEFKPDAIHIHLLTGFGYNSIKTLKKARVPVLYFLHDLGLGCLRANMYKNGHNCAAPCTECRLSASYKSALIAGADQFTFISPSRDNLDTLRSLIDLSGSKCQVIANIDLEVPKPRCKGSSTLRLIYVGRLHETKGVDFLFDVMKDPALSAKPVKLTVVGGGPQEDHLRHRAETDSRIEIVGRVTPERVKEYVSDSDVLCVPSLWRENHPGVIRQALRAGVPVLVSRIGGAPEMIADHVDGLILPPGDRTAWASAIAELSANREHLDHLQTGAVATGRSYSADELGRQLIETQSSSFANLQAVEESIA